MRHATCRRFVSSILLLKSPVSVRTNGYSVFWYQFNHVGCHRLHYMYIYTYIYIAYVISELGLLSLFASFSTYKMRFVPTLGIGIACRWDAPKTDTFMSAHSSVCQRGVKRSIIRICLKLQLSYYTWSSIKRLCQIYRDSILLFLSLWKWMIYHR